MACNGNMAISWLADHRGVIIHAFVQVLGASFKNCCWGCVSRWQKHTLKRKYLHLVTLGSKALQPTATSEHRTKS
jgi:hypothetical protein